jgi:hypothetical protein
MTDDVVTHMAIHPAIGIARVGNSPNGFFFGSEVIGERRDETTYRASTVGSSLVGGIGQLQGRLVRVRPGARHSR